MKRLKMTPLAMLVLAIFASSSFSQDRTQVESQERRRKKNANKTAEQCYQLPKFLTQLNLTAQQEQNVRKIVETHNQKTQDVWSEFHRLHWQAVELEAGLAAANQLAGHDHDAHHDNKDRQSNNKKSSATEERDQPASSTSKEKPSKAKRAQRGKTNPLSDVEVRQKQTRTRSENSADQSAKSGSQISRDKADWDVNIVGMRVAVLQPNGMIREIYLAGNLPTDEQECEICQAQKQELGDLWKKIHKLHGHLVQIEADYMISIESELTQKQLNQLESSATDSATNRDRSATKKQKE